MFAENLFKRIKIRETFVIIDHNKSEIAAILLCALVVFSSILQGLYIADLHHWGQLLTNAIDLNRGYLPYKEIFIQYGILTTVVQSIWMHIFGETLYSLITITALFYAAGLYCIYLICLSITHKEKISIIALLTCILIHPIAMLPWSNYIAFPFIMLAIYFEIRALSNLRDIFLSGFLFGLAFLARQDLIIAIVAILLGSSIVDISFGASIANCIKKNLIRILGLMCPVVFFMIYLFINDLFPYWIKLSFDLPKLYTKEMFTHVKGFGIFMPLVASFIEGFTRPDVRWLIVFAVVISSSLILFSAAIRFFVNKEIFGGISNSKTAFVSIASLGLFSSVIHLQDMFRISTGSIVGVIILYLFLERLRLAYIFFIITSPFLGYSLMSQNSGNPYLPTSKMVIEAETVVTPSYFKGERWNGHIVNYYRELSSSFNEIKSSGCSIHWHFNNTFDASIHAFSGSRPLQISPAGDGPYGLVSQSWHDLRPDLNFKSAIERAEDIMIFDTVNKMDLDQIYKVPDKFFIYKKLDVPTEIRLGGLFIKPNTVFLLILPKKCEILMRHVETSL